MNAVPPARKPVPHAAHGVDCTGERTLNVAGDVLDLFPRPLEWRLNDLAETRQGGADRAGDATKEIDHPLEPVDDQVPRSAPTV